VSDLAAIAIVIVACLLVILAGYYGSGQDGH
jgi:hypothetical protein